MGEFVNAGYRGLRGPAMAFGVDPIADSRANLHLTKNARVGPDPESVSPAAIWRVKTIDSLHFAGWSTFHGVRKSFCRTSGSARLFTKDTFRPSSVRTLKLAEGRAAGYWLQASKFEQAMESSVRSRPQNGKLGTNGGLPPRNKKAKIATASSLSSSGRGPGGGAPDGLPR